MLVRILTDNPGPTFTRNLDKKFAETVKELLKTGKDRSVLNLLMEMLDEFEYTKVGDEGLTPLIEMWKKEKEKGFKNEVRHGSRAPSRTRDPATYQCLTHPQFTGAQPPAQQTWRPSNNHHNTHFSNSSSRRPSRLPAPEELASRLEEASTSAKLLTQFVTSSTAQELLESDLVREFASRCQSASKSVQGYMASEDPAPDNDTMESLLDINEQLQAALNAHQRAVLSAKKSLGISGGAGTPPVGAQEDPAASVSGALGDLNGAPSQAGSSRAPSVSRPRNNGKGREETPGKGKGAAGYEPPPGPPPGWNTHAEDPFRDPHDDANNQQQQGGSSYLGSEALVFDSFHPGFTNAGAAAGGSGTGTGTGSGYGPRRPEYDDDIYDSAPRR